MAYGIRQVNSQSTCQNFALLIAYLVNIYIDLVNIYIDLRNYRKSDDIWVTNITSSACAKNMKKHIRCKQHRNSTPKHKTIGTTTDVSPLNNQKYKITGGLKLVSCLLLGPPGFNLCFSFSPELVSYLEPRDLHRWAAY